MIIAIDGPSGPASPPSRRRLPRSWVSRASTPGRCTAPWRGRRSPTAWRSDDDAALGDVARTHAIAFGHVEGDPVPRRVSIGGVDVTDAIRTARDRPGRQPRVGGAFRARGAGGAAAPHRAGGQLRGGGARHRHGGVPRSRGEGVPDRLRRGARPPARAAERGPRGGLPSTTPRCWLTCVAATPPTRRARRRPCGPRPTPCTWIPPGAT